MIYEYITETSFRNAFRRAGRGDVFSIDALTLIYECLQDVELDVELDVVGICCEFEENTARELIADHALVEEGEELSDHEIFERIEAFLSSETRFLGVTPSGTFVYVAF